MKPEKNKSVAAGNDLPAAHNHSQKIVDRPVIGYDFENSIAAAAFVETWIKKGIDVDVYLEQPTTHHKVVAATIARLLHERHNMRAAIYFSYDENQRRLRVSRKPIPQE